MANSDVDRLKNCSNRVAPNYACFNFTKQYVYTTFLSTSLLCASIPHFNLVLVLGGNPYFNSSYNTIFLQVPCTSIPHFNLVLGGNPYFNSS